MENDFSIMEMIKYCAKKWLIILIVAVIGCGSFTVFSYIFKKDVNVVRCNGSATVASLNILYPEINDDITKEIYGNIISAYNQNLTRALNVMSLSSLKQNVYNMVKDEYPLDAKKDKINNEQEFMNALTVTKTEISIEVNCISRNNTQKEINLVNRIVDLYLNSAIDSAKADNPIFNSSKAIIKSSLSNSDVIISADGKVEDINLAKKKNVFIDMLIGLGSGFVLGLIVTVIIYFADKRIKSYGEIACVTGDRLLGVVCGEDNTAIYPKIDAGMFNKKAKTVLVTSSAKLGSVLGESYAKYCASAGSKTLLIKFSAGGNDSFSQALSGDVATVDGYGCVDIKDNEWKVVLNNKKQFIEATAGYDRIILACDYLANGALAVLGQISDAVVIAVEQSVTTKKKLYALLEEINDLDKMLGAAIYNPAPSYVGEII